MKNLDLLVAVIGIFILALFVAISSPAEEQEVIKLTRYNTIVFAGKIDVVFVDVFANAIVSKRSFLPIEEPLYVVVVSGGGDYQASLAMKNFLMEIPNTVTICKYCASAAGGLFATSKHRLAISKSELLMHEMYLQKFTDSMQHTPGILAGLHEASDELNKTMYTILKIPKAVYEYKIRGTEWILKGRELVQWNMADKYVNISCDEYIKVLLPDTCSL